MHRSSLLTIILLFACQTSYSLKFQNEEGGFPDSSELLKNAQGENQQLASIGRLRAEMSCTASLWRPRVDARGPVLALTNGHCVMPYTDRATTSNVWLNRPAPASWQLTLNNFVDTSAQKKTYPVKSIVYATMKAVDLAVIELDTSWEQVTKDGLDPLRLAMQATDAGSDIRVIGIPEQGFTQADRFLREARCVEETRVSIVEWYWTWWDEHRNSCADVREGSSGSPVLNAAGEVYALINTTSTGGNSESCYLSNPCEMQRPGAFMVARKNYAIDLFGLEQCFGASGLSFGTGCPLPPPATITYSGAPPVPTRPVDRQGQPIHWELVSDPALWKTGPVGEIDCRNIRDYQEGSVPNKEVPTGNGVYLLCLLASGADERFPTTVVLSIDTKAPTLKPELSQRPGPRGVSFEPIFQVPELSAFWIAYGPLASTDCEQVPLQPYRRIPVPIDSKQLPAKVCVRGEDHAGNLGPIFDYVINAR